MQNTTRLGLVLGISIAFFLVEIAVGFRTKSLALIADAFHYLNDIVAYAISFVAANLQKNGTSSSEFTYAFQRAELTGAFFNGVFLLALALSIFLQSIERFINLETVESPVLVLIVGCIGLTLNLVSVFVVHDHGGHGHGDDSVETTSDLLVAPNANEIHALHNHFIAPPTKAPEHNLGLMGVLVHLFGDASNNVGVILAAVIMWKTMSPKRFYADPAVSLAISLIIFASAVPLTLKSGRILLDATPQHLDLERIRDDLTTVPNVLSIHDFHVWQLSQSVVLASLHVRVSDGTSLEEWEQTQLHLQECFAAYDIWHATISPEIQSGIGQMSTSDNEGGGCNNPFHQDGFGCDVGQVRRRAQVNPQAAV